MEFEQILHYIVILKNYNNTTLRFFLKTKLINRTAVLFNGIAKFIPTSDFNDFLLEKYTFADFK